MKSNGFGRFQQKVIVRVPKDHAKVAGEKLGLAPFKETSDPARVYFEWTRLAVRTGNDEDVVFDLAVMLGEAHETIEWQIDWKNSVY